MEARDGSVGFDFSGEYGKVELHRQIEYVMDDGRKVRVSFTPKGNETEVAESFEAEQLNSIELQRNGWQAILDNFKIYVEAYGNLEVVHFEIIIDAAVEKVFNTMLDEVGFAQWTSVFNPASRFEGSWDKG